METTTKIVFVEPTKENIEATIEKIVKYAQSQGYQILGDFKKKDSLLGKIFGSDPKFDSKKQLKACRKYLTRIDKKIGMSISNRFLHFLYKKVYKMDDSPRIEYSQKELKIREAKKKWREAQKISDSLRLKYKEEKGDFFKK